jgi:two-component system cell cycle response regulator
VTTADRRQHIRDNRARVLVVDDHADTCELYDFGLQRAGFDVTCAGDGPGALAALVAAPFAAVVIDAELPGMDGWDVIAQIKATPALAALPIVMVSAHAFPDARTRAMAAGCRSFFAKPCLPSELADALRHVIYGAEVSAGS